MIGIPDNEGATVLASSANRASRHAPELRPADMPVFSIPIDAIFIPGARMRSLKMPQALAIGGAIAADRQYAPISVATRPGNDGFQLVDGLHRLVGMRELGAKTIDAKVVPWDEVALRREEVASAWARADHDAFDRAAQVAGLVEIAKSEDPVQTIGLGLNWTEATAEALGVKRSTIFNYLRIHRHYDDQDKTILRGLKQASELVPLLRLAALPPKAFNAAMLGLKEGSFPTIADALAPPSESAPSVFQKKTDAFLTFFHKRSERERANFIAGLLAEYHEDGQKRAKLDTGGVK